MMEHKLIWISNLTLFFAANILLTNIELSERTAIVAVAFFMSWLASMFYGLAVGGSFKAKHNKD